MRNTHRKCLLVASLLVTLAMSGLSARSFALVNHFNELANLPFAEGRPTKETTQKLKDELLFQRATQTYLWAMPLINTLGMQVGLRRKRSALATTFCQSGRSGSTRKPW